MVFELIKFISLPTPRIPSVYSLYPVRIQSNIFPNYFLVIQEITLDLMGIGCYQNNF